MKFERLLKSRSFWKRVFLYCLGLFVMAMGVSFAVKSNLGISPVNSIPYILSRVTGLEQGNLTTAVFCFFILLQLLILRKEFKLHYMFEIICALLFGKFVTLSNWMISFSAPQSYPIRLLLTCISILFVAAGMTLYLCADLIPQPAEGLCLAIEKKSGWKYSNIKTVFDCSLVAIAALITLLATKSLSGLREGTVLTMLSVGKLIGFFMSKFKAPLLRFIGK